MSFGRFTRIFSSDVRRFVATNKVRPTLVMQRELMTFGPADAECFDGAILAHHDPPRAEFRLPGRVFDLVKRADDLYVLSVWDAAVAFWSPKERRGPKSEGASPSRKEFELRTYGVEDLVAIMTRHSITIRERHVASGDSKLDLDESSWQEVAIWSGAWVALEQSWLE
ncbi:hypothetical protein PG987_004879 [Apiospora arundinis]